MTKTPAELQHLKTEAQASLNEAASADALETWRVKYIGRKGALPLFLREVKKLPLAERKEIGQAANALRRELEELYEKKQQELASRNNESGQKPKRQIPNSKFQLPAGHLHPITLTIRRLREIFAAMGFLIVEGPETEEAKYNFDQLNIPFEHPARAETDTFYIQDHPDVVLRTHVSPMQVRAVIEHSLTPPFRFMYYDRCFRNEKVDATHESTFHQFEYMVVQKSITIADLKGIAETIYSTFFGKPVNIRFRPSYFPFVEPGLEVDISCVFCGGKGCRICKNSGWIEMAGAGMVHPNVLRNVNVDPKEYQGIAMGAAVDRLAMLQYGIDDIRLFWSGDIRFLRQFS